MIAPARPPQRVMAILQLTRIGDIVQTAQAFEGFREAHPDIRLIFIGRKQYAKPVEFLLNENFDHVYYIDQLRITRPPLNRITLDDSILAAKEQIDAINSENIDVLINLSFSKTSSYLAPLIKATHKLGHNRDDLDNLIIKDQWSQFVYSNVMGSTLAPYNLVDVYKRIAGYSLIPTKYLSNVREANTIDNIIVHPFASSVKKQWSATKWSNLLLNLLNENPNITITMVGAEGDRPKAEQILSASFLDRHSNRIINRTGKTRIKDVFESFNSKVLFIGHDSLISHLASYKSIPSLIISLGPVRPHETTSYGNQSIAVAPRLDCFPCPATATCAGLECHKEISEKIVSYLAKSKIINQELTTENLQADLPDLLLSKVNIYRSNMLDGHGQYLEEISGNNPSAENIMRTLFTIMWNFVISDIDLDSSIPYVSEGVGQKLKPYFQGLASLYELNEFGITYSDYILKESQSAAPSLENIREYGAKLNEIDKLQLLLTRSYPMLSPIINHFHIKKGFMPGKGVHELAQSSLLTYHEANNAVGALHDLLQNCFELNGILPKAAQSSAEHLGPDN